ncbi:MAG: MATE family efflux transporter [Eubacteriales bacterium]
MENTKDSILLTGKLHKIYLKFTLPALIAMLISGIQGMIDGIFVGNIIGSNAMASVNIAIPFLQLIIGLSMVVSIGAQSHIGLKLGFGSVKEAQDTFQSFFRIIIVVAAGITCLGVFFSEEIARLIGANDVLIEETAIYIRTLAFFAIPIVLMFYFGFLNRIIGKPEMYFKGTILSLLVNISMDYLLIAKLQWGIFGAALATGLSYSSALLIVVWPMLDRKNIINALTGCFDKRCVKPVLFNGSSEGVNSLSIALNAYLFNMMMMKIAGEDGVAAFTAINYVANLGILISFGISDGVGPIVSYNYGYGNFERVKKSMRIAYIVNLCLGILVFSVLFFCGESLVSIFIKDNQEIIDIATQGGKLYGIAFLMAGFNILNSGYFTFIGQGLNSVMVAASRGVIFVTISIFVLPIFIGINGVWLSVPFAELCSMLIGLYLLHKNTKKDKIHR